MDQNVAETILDAVRSANQLVTVGNDRFLVVPSGYEAKDLEFLGTGPRRINKSVGFHRLDSLCRYILEFKDDTTIVLINQQTGYVSCTLDYHAPDGPAWCGHTATFSPVPTEEWKRWWNKNGVSLSQRELAEFIEENAPDIVDPPSAELLDVARSLTARMNVNFKRAIVLEDDTVQLAFEETIEAKAGAKGTLDIPSSFVVNIAVFAGGLVAPLEVRLRYSIKEGMLSFRLVLVRPHKQIEQAISHIAAEIETVTKIKPYYGS